jgi:hypothetical protein
MQITPPTEAEVASLVAAHAHRFPAKYTLTVPGDGGKTVRLPVLVGNPSGAAPLPGEKPSPAWSIIVAAALRLRTEAPGLSQQVAEDCVLWPPPASWAQWLARWPGLPAKLADLISAKVAAEPNAIEQPADGDEPPQPLQAILASHPAAAWRRARAQGEVFAIALEPPGGTAWKLWQEALHKPKADAWKLVRELVEACVRGVVAVKGDNATTCDLDETIRRWPGLAVMLVGELGELVGAAAEVEAGGW